MVFLGGGGVTRLAIQQPYVGPGDLVPGALGWWGLRAYSSKRIGYPCVRLIASTDAGLTGPQQDFVALPNGRLDVASVTAFAAANPGTTLYVVKLYDQTNGGQDLTPFAATANYVPKYVFANGRPTVFQDNLNMNLTSGGPGFGTPTLTVGSPLTLNSVFNFNEAEFGVAPIELGAVGPNFTRMGIQCNFNNANPNTVEIYSILSGTPSLGPFMACTDFVWHTVIGVYDGASSVGYVDGVATAAPGLPPVAADPNGFAALFGTSFGGTAMTGSGLEGGAWAFDWTAAQATAVTVNQRGFWNF